MAENTFAATDSSFEQEVLKSAVPVLVDFWAAWCVPCKMIAPTLEELGAEFAGRARVAKVNVDENKSTAGRYGIRGIPTL
ncbi:MAG TPA: thioredoxin domain-containing protein, partial [Candidatus Methanoperedens sp.]|nr:thioredoxin domain-containing protein [Candidatus Methanoperedens sp.]